MSKHVLDLFAGLGGFSSAFQDDPSWKVTTVEINERFNPDIQADIFELKPSDLPDADLILASPPCTYFSTAGNHDAWKSGTPVTDAAKNAVGLVYHTLGLINGIDPLYWYLENPRGRLRNIIGKPEGCVTYCQYGAGYMKPTDLWGEHPRTMEYRYCGYGYNCHETNLHDDGNSATYPMPTDPAEKAKVPYELSEAIKEAVEGVSEQSTLEDIAV
jgi:hypothetical protein